LVRPSRRAGATTQTSLRASGLMVPTSGSVSTVNSLGTQPEKFYQRCWNYLKTETSEVGGIGRVVLNLERKVHAPGLSYVAISRIKRFSSIMFQTPVDLSRFRTKESTDMKVRARDWNVRTLGQSSNKSLKMALSEKIRILHG
jgi:hypothetical protein